MSIRLKLSLLLLGLFFAATGNTLFTYILEGNSEEKLGWVIHTHEVMTESGALLGAMTDAETGQRGYLLTGDSSYLDPYQRGTITANESLATLLSITSDNPAQQMRLAKIGESMKAKFDELESTIALRRQGGEENAMEAVRIVSEDYGKQHMDAIRMELSDFENVERLLLEVRNGDYRASKTQVNTVIVAELVLFLFLGMFTLFFIRDKLFAPMRILLESTAKMERGEKQNIEDLLPKDEMGYLLSSFYKMSEKVDAKAAALAYEATHDVLTGLNNRTGLEEEIGNAIAGLAGSDSKAAVFFIDLNKFKQLNDSLGHDAGDAILKEAASRLQKSLRSEDKVFRVGGDEFVVLLTNIARAEDVKTVVTNVLKELASSFVYQGTSIEISASIGIVVSPDDSNSGVELLKFADVAMYDAKRNNDSDYSFFSKDMLKRGSDE